MLPDGDGVEVCRALREWSQMPILVLSAVGDEDHKVEALEAGADDYVTKPFSPRELVARLQAVLRRAAPREDEPVIQADGLQVDVAARVVRRGGEEVHLTPIEFDLLRMLVRNRGRLLAPRVCCRRSGARRTPRMSRPCAPTSPGCVASSNARTTAGGDTSARIRASATASTLSAPL